MNISKLKLGKRYISNITAAVQGAGKNPRLQMQQIDPALIGSQYLIAEGTMALNIILTNWTSDTWQMYIHSQVLKLY